VIVAATSIASTVRERVHTIPPIPLNRLKMNPITTTQQNEGKESIIVTYDLIIVVLEVFKIP
jgi:hypothetical protein